MSEFEESECEVEEREKRNIHERLDILIKLDEFR
jgi:hypothetical protein